MKGAKEPRLRVSVTTLGCRSNQYDSAAMEELAAAGGFETVAFPAPADAYVINTCTVTARTDAQSRNLVRRARRLNPEAVVIVTGCYAQVSPGEAAAIEGVDYVLGNAEKARIVEYISRGRRSGAETAVSGNGRATFPAMRARSAGGRARANLKIQDGCDRRCSYCIIPAARGPSRSMAIEEALAEMEALAEAGFAEVVLTGIHLGAYGRDLSPRRSLAELLERVEASNLRIRVRLSSIDPDEVDERMIELLSGASRVCNHLHLPLQSGDDSVLRRMNRPYDRRLFARLVERLAGAVDGVAIGADVMAGFPGEGEREFANTVELIEELPLAYLHVFPFSRRKGTAAAAMAEQVDSAIIKERAARLRELDGEKRRAFCSRFVGREAAVLIEGKGNGAVLRGRSRNYLPVALSGPDDLMGREASVRLSGFDGSVMRGELAG